MKTAILDKNDLNIDIKEQVFELFRQLSQNKIQLDLEEILNEKNQITVAYCEDNNKKFWHVRNNGVVHVKRVKDSLFVQ